MSYYVSLKDEVRRMIRDWKLSSSMIRAVLDGLDALRTNPAEKLIRVGPPYDVMQYDVTVANPDNDFLAEMFTFTVKYSADEETLLVVDCERMGPDLAD